MLYRWQIFKQQQQDTGSLVSNFNDSAQLYFTAVIYCLHGKLTTVISLWSTWPKWNLHRSEFHSARSHVNADNEVTHTELKFYPEVKSQTGLSSLRVSCKRALRNQTMIFIKAFLLVLLFFIHFQLVIVINSFMTEAVII